VELLVQGNDEKSGIRIHIRVPLCLLDEHLLMNTGADKGRGNDGSLSRRKGRSCVSRRKGVGWG
jgi:hypothetical protein